MAWYGKTRMQVHRENGFARLLLPARGEKVGMRGLSAILSDADQPKALETSRGFSAKRKRPRTRGEGVTRRASQLLKTTAAPRRVE
jgi:hypothetical protein